MQKKKKPSAIKIILVTVAGIGLLAGSFVPFIPYIISLF